jgi:hypothetical protein
LMITYALCKCSYSLFHLSLLLPNNISYNTAYRNYTRIILPNGQGSAAGHGHPIPILPEIPEARFTIRASRLGGRLQRMVGCICMYNNFLYKHSVAL